MLHTYSATDGFLDSGFLQALDINQLPFGKRLSHSTTLPEAFAFRTTGIIEIMEDVAFLREGDPGMNYSFAHFRTSHPSALPPPLSIPACALVNPTSSKKTSPTPVPSR